MTSRLAECGSETPALRRLWPAVLTFKPGTRSRASACVEDPSFPILPAMKRNGLPASWDEARAESVLEHYEQQTEDEALAEDDDGGLAHGASAVTRFGRPEIDAATRMTSLARAE